MAKYLICAVGFASILALPLKAEVLRDPTLPPVQSGLVPAERLPAVALAPVLQSITLGSTHKFAMINGQTVMLGGVYEGWTLVRLTANEAVLRAKDGKTKVLAMDYAMQKQGASAPIAQPPAARNKPAANTAVDSITRSNLTESPQAQVRMQAESLWVKQ